MINLVAELAHFLYARPQPIRLASLVECILTYGGEPEHHNGTVGHLLWDLLMSANVLMSAFYHHQSVSEWVHGVNQAACAEELQTLVRKDSGWHFSVLSAHAEQITKFKLETMAARAQALDSTLWHLLMALMHANQRSASTTQQKQERDAEDEYLAQVEGLEDENLIGGNARENLEVTRK
ncbi:uncharacterized protein PHACADRAFT_33511 [Phanerochaete carnosa HHB-10118-sp]|uniref:Uncharacterized protein n=1 Tax=Phanerochaete carnosa (strain HHB-10118-sp) TaxID=650164 RepID=K5VEB1_PHACS|nr:uncharacterized protein PHACADRAFT_33511 [Phanerochaete carnosa HHB-10118-sp]EKM49483.1 hypothetical protein PHACADRAFT_33511 [Phanerochaete carnosa HHB-10118-sp]